MRVTIELTVRDLRKDDLASCAWSGSALHVRGLPRQLERVAAGDMDYLAVCPPSGVPVGIGGVDYRMRQGAGCLVQLSVHPALQSCGIGTVLVRAAEGRIRARGLVHAHLAVEDENPRARALYERLGYTAVGYGLSGWEELEPEGMLCTMMRKVLRAN